MVKGCNLLLFSDLNFWRQRLCILSLKWVWWEILRFKNIMRNKQKWITSKLKGDYLEIDQVMGIAVFQCLVHYMKNDGGLERSSYDWDKEVVRVNMSQEEADRIKKEGELLIRCYDYIQMERPLFVEKMRKETDWRELERLDKELYEKDTEIMKIIVENRGILWS